MKLIRFRNWVLDPKRFVGATIEPATEPQDLALGPWVVILCMEGKVSREGRVFISFPSESAAHDGLNELHSMLYIMDIE